MPVVIPAGRPPVETVPRFVQPTTGKPKPQWTVFLDDNRQEIRGMLATPLSEDEIGRLFRTDLNLFFINKRFNNLRGHIHPARKALEAHLDSLSKPARDEIEAIATPGEPQPTALAKILRLSKAFQVAIDHKNADAIAYFELDAGNPLDPANGAVVVPSVYGIEPKVLRDHRRRLGGDDRGYRAFLQSAGVRASQVDIFEGYLEVTNRSGRKTGRFPYLVTLATATKIFEYLRDCAAQNGHSNGGLGVGAVGELFTIDLDEASTVGKSEALPVRAGNII